MTGDYEDRIAKLEADARASEAHTRKLHAREVAREEHIAGLDAQALARDEQILALVKEVEGLQRAKVNAATIEQAKGIIMASIKCTPDAAFAALVAASQKHHRKLVDIAAEVVATKGNIP